MFKVEIIGNLGVDARVESVNGSEFLAFSVAHNEKIGDHEETLWVSVSLPVSFRGALPYLKKGARVFVRGGFGLRMYHSSFSHQREAGINLYGRELEIITYPDMKNLESRSEATEEDERPFNGDEE
ncbi:MAG: single-stranded DNA-binding protein [Clostridia bacterium]|nr:single-stranded DNA-binding protein [Clostridia bacterium]